MRWKLYWVVAVLAGLYFAKLGYVHELHEDRIRLFFDVLDAGMCFHGALNSYGYAWPKHRRDRNTLD